MYSFPRSNPLISYPIWNSSEILCIQYRTDSAGCIYIFVYWYFVYTLNIYVTITKKRGQWNWQSWGSRYERSVGRKGNGGKYYSYILIKQKYDTKLNYIVNSILKDTALGLWAGWTFCLSFLIFKIIKVYGDKCIQWPENSVWHILGIIASIVSIFIRILTRDTAK